MLGDLLLLICSEDLPEPCGPCMPTNIGRSEDGRCLYAVCCWATKAAIRWTFAFRPAFMMDTSERFEARRDYLRASRDEDNLSRTSFGRVKPE
jgi:hypothetical protein